MQPNSLPLKLLQIARTLGEPCGIGNFAQELEAALRELGVEVKTQRELLWDGNCDLVLVQHEWGIIEKEGLRAFCKSCPKPVILFGHTSDVSIFDDVVSGYIVMDRAIAGCSSRPILTIYHPADVPKTLSDRAQLRRLYGLPENRTIVGSSGFLLEPRRFPWFVDQLLDRAITKDFFIYLLAPEHKNTSFHLQQVLRGAEETFPDYFRYENKFLPRQELNSRLQACDMLWCWTEVAEKWHYASGVASDMYGSGTRMVLADKRQHQYILQMPNVVKAPSDQVKFLETLLHEISTGNFSRHDPDAVSWHGAAQKIITFMQSVVSRRG